MLNILRYLGEMVKEFFKNIYDEIRYISNGIINIIKWTPVIFKDKWWDDYYFFKLLEFKLKIMEVSFKTKGHHLYAERDSKKMKICRILCKRISDENYYDNVFQDHDKKWGELKMKVHNDNGIEFRQVSFERPNCITEKDKEKEHKECQRLWKKEEYLKNQDLDLLFKTIRKNIQGWWD
jgi:hypothetical protein